MHKIACIFSYQKSSWVSCQKIVFNLHKAYQSNTDFELRNFNYTTNEMNDSGDIAKTAKEIVNWMPDVISIMDHKPHPLLLLQAIHQNYGSKKKPKLIFHIFGDFTIFYLNWARLASIITEYEVEFLVASDRQKILIDKMLDGQNSIVCPFPVDDNDFYFDEELRNEQRKKWGFTQKDVIYLFTGRLSRQKRIKTLVKTFSEELANEPNAHLFIYGSPDNIGDPFLGKYDMEGEYFRVFYKTYKQQPEEVQKRIHFIGAVPNKDLLKVYQGADVLVNLSVHNDEDYGMSVAEAQATGLACALTDWGGLASFYHPELKNAVKFIPVTIGEKSKVVSQKLTKNIFRYYFENPRPHCRQRIVESAIAKFGIERAKSIIHEAVVKPSEVFMGFSDLFSRAQASQMISSTDQMYISKKLVINRLFRDIYSAYVRNN